LPVPNRSSNLVSIEHVQAALAKPKEPRIPLPKGWQGCVKSAVLHAIALVHYAIVYARAWTAADSINARVRLSAENDRLQEECALLREELRIKLKKRSFSNGGFSLQIEITCYIMQG
jgi:hypothetical protein